MELIPIIPTSEHTGYILKNDKFKHFREIEKNGTTVVRTGNFCTSLPETYTLIEELLSEWAMITSSQYIHVGGEGD